MTLRLFVGSVWLTAATTLLCALLPTGLPQTSTVGSAFSPSTTTVALHSARPDSRTERADAVRPRDPDAGMGVGAILPVAVSAILFVPVALAVIRPGIVQMPVTCRPRGSAYPRGPPMADIEADRA